MASEGAVRVFEDVAVVGDRLEVTRRFVERFLSRFLFFDPIGVFLFESAFRFFFVGERFATRRVDFVAFGRVGRFAERGSFGQKGGKFANGRRRGGFGFGRGVGGRRVAGERAERRRVENGKGRIERREGRVGVVGGGRGKVGVRSGRVERRKRFVRLSAKRRRFREGRVESERSGGSGVAAKSATAADAQTESERRDRERAGGERRKGRFFTLRHCELPSFEGASWAGWR